MGHQSKVKQQRNQSGTVSEDMRKLQREMGRKALIMHVSSGGNNDPFEALGSLFSEYIQAQQDDNAKISTMAAAIEWLMQATGLAQGDIISELSRRGQEITQQRAAKAQMMADQPGQVVQ